METRALAKVQLETATEEEVGRFGRSAKMIARIRRQVYRWLDRFGVEPKAFRGE